MTTIKLDNSGSLDVPGFNHVPLEYEIPCEHRFAHGIDEWRQIPAVTARELAMVRAMNTLTDKANWHVNVFDDDIIANWRDELSSPLMSDSAWSWCVAELRDKALAFDQDRFVHVLDTGSCVCKSDNTIASSVGETIKSDVASLLEDIHEDWKRGSNKDQVFDVVDPYMYPLVYRKSRAFSESIQTALHNVFGSSENTEVAPEQTGERVGAEIIQSCIEQGITAGWRSHHNMFPRSWSSPLRPISSYHWSYQFQQLPCEVEFTNTTNTAVRITSYVNNLHPTHKSLYQGLEVVLGHSIKLWNSCIIKGQKHWTREEECWGNNRHQRGRVPLRIITYGVEWENLFPDWAMAFNIPQRSKLRRFKEAQETLRRTPEGVDKKSDKQRRNAQREIDSMPDMKGRENMPEPTPELWDMAERYLRMPEIGSTSPAELPDNWKTAIWHRLRAKHRSLLRFKHPEPGVAFSYAEWKSGTNNDRPVVEMVTARPHCEFDRMHPLPGGAKHTPYNVCLEDTFRNEGLQVIIKISSIDLNSTAPQYGGGTWKIEGHMNEHIVATAIYPFDVRNVTTPRISFRQYTPINSDYYRVRPWQFEDNCNPFNPPAKHVNTMSVAITAIAEILGLEEESIIYDTPPSGVHPLPFQEIGSVMLPEGRLIAFPNTFEHRIESFELCDSQVDGNFRWITLNLVDPHYRVCSTKNVPAQQHDWWGAPVASILKARGLPQEVANQIIDECEDWPMGNNEAEGYRVKMRNEHQAMHVAKSCQMQLGSF